MTEPTAFTITRGLYARLLGLLQSVQSDTGAMPEARAEARVVGDLLAEVGHERAHRGPHGQ